MRRKVSLVVAGFAMAIGVGLVAAPSANADIHGFYHSYSECEAALQAKMRETRKPYYCILQGDGPNTDMWSLSDVGGGG